jgi:TPR repeat protein
MMLLALALALGQTAPSEAENWRALLSAGKEAQAVAEVQARARTGDAEALDFLGWFYDEGRGLPADPAKAADAYRRGAEAGNKHAQWRYGVLLDTGQGVAADPVAAMRWFEKSAAQGFTNALVSIGMLYSGGRGVPKDNAKALASYREAARCRNLSSFAEIGIVYQLGEGVTPDRDEAAAWFLIGATFGDEKAKQLLSRLMDGMDDAAKKKTGERATAIANELKLGQSGD